MKTSALPFDGVDAVPVPFGYAPADWRFLRLAALHGGYFVRRQVAQFLGCRDGGRVAEFIERAIDLEHIQSSSWRKNMLVFHVSARPVYAAVGERENRNRRRHGRAQTKNRVMRLDAVLANPDAQALSAERQRREHFGRWGVPETKPFGEQYPVFIRPLDATSGLGRLALTFVDEGLVGLSKFSRFLEFNRSLFDALPSFEVMYVADVDRHFVRARALFERLTAAPLLTRVQGPCAAASASSSAPLHDYFTLRKRYEDRAFGDFGRADLTRLRDLRARYSGPEIEAQFNAWQARAMLHSVPSSDLFSTQETPPESAPRMPKSGTFSTLLLPHDYSFFGGFGAF